MRKSFQLLALVVWSSVGVSQAFGKIKARHSLGPTIENQPNAVKARHSLGPTIENKPEAIKAGQNLTTSEVSENQNSELDLNRE